MQVFLAHPLVKTCPLVPVYFKSKAQNEESKAALQNLIAYMNGQPIIKQPAGRFTASIEHRGGGQGGQQAQNPNRVEND